MATEAAAAPEAGLFGPDTVIWRVNRELVLLAGGGRALLLQVAHPLVAAGVAEHSDYERDPWGRLIRTLELTTKIVFGDGSASQAASRRLDRVHGEVRGTAADGTPYEARDPDLLLWVWATLVDSALLVYQSCVRPLPGAELSRYYDEQREFARACGVPDGRCPETLAGFRDYYEHMVASELRVTEPARRVADSVMSPGVPWPLLPAFAPNRLLTIGLLPPGLRAEYGFGWGPAQERLLSLATGSLRRLVPLLPGPARHFPEARAAFARSG